MTETMSNNFIIPASHRVFTCPQCTTALLIPSSQQILPVQCGACNTLTNVLPDVTAAQLVLQAPPIVNQQMPLNTQQGTMVQPPPSASMAMSSTSMSAPLNTSPETESYEQAVIKHKNRQWQTCCGMAVLGSTLITTVISIGLGITYMITILPALVLLYFLYWRKHREKVAPFVVLQLFWSMFLFTFIMFFPLQGLGLALHQMDAVKGAAWGIFKAFVSAFFAAAMIEETMKYIMITRVRGATHDEPTPVCERFGVNPITRCLNNFNVNHWRYEVNHPYAVMICGYAAALGFATLENVVYVFGTLLNGGIPILVALMRAFLAVPGHALWGGLCGYGIARRIFYGERLKWSYRRVVGLPFLLHALYDFFLMSTQNLYLAIGPSAIWLPILGFVLSIAVYCTGCCIVKNRIKELTDDYNPLSVQQYQAQQLELYAEHERTKKIEQQRKAAVKINPAGASSSSSVPSGSSISILSPNSEQARLMSYVDVEDLENGTNAQILNGTRDVVRTL